MPITSKLGLAELLYWQEMYYSSLEHSLDEKVGDAGDLPSENSLHAKINKDIYSNQSDQNCYPRYKPSIQVVSSTSEYVIGASATIVGQKVNLDNADAVDYGGGVIGIPITGHPFFPSQTVVISGTVNYDGIHTYELILYRTEAWHGYEIARIPFTKTADNDGEGFKQVKSPLLPACSYYPDPSKIVAVLTSSNAVADTANIKLVYHTFTIS
jgi:hypothetical protein